MINHYLIYSYTTRLYLKTLRDDTSYTPEEWTIDPKAAMKFITRASANKGMVQLKRNNIDVCMIIPVSGESTKMKTFNVKTEMVQEGTFERQEVISGESDLEVLNKVFKGSVVIGDIAAVKIRPYKKVKANIGV